MVGGFVGTEDQWKPLEVLWRDALPNGISYLHATDCFGGRGKFRDVPIAVRSALLDQLIQLIIDANIRLICGAIHVPTYSRFAPRRLRNAFLGNKYVAAGEQAIELACVAIPATGPIPESPGKNDSPNEKCNFFFEHNDYQASMVQAIARLRQDELQWWRHRIGAETSGTKLGSGAIPLLQVGDLGAYLSAKRISDAPEGRISWKAYYAKLEAAKRVLKLQWADQRSVELLAGLDETLRREVAEGKRYWDDI